MYSGAVNGRTDNAVAKKKKDKRANNYRKHITQKTND